MNFSVNHILVFQGKHQMTLRPSIFDLFPVPETFTWSGGVLKHGFSKSHSYSEGMDGEHVHSFCRPHRFMGHRTFCPGPKEG